MYRENFEAAMENQVHPTIGAWADDDRSRRKLARA